MRPNKVIPTPRPASALSALYVLWTLAIFLGAAPIRAAEGMVDSTGVPIQEAVDPAPETRIHLRAHLGKGFDAPRGSHGGNGIGILWDMEIGGLVAGVQATAIFEVPEFLGVDTLLPLEHYNLVGLYAGKTSRGRNHLITGALGVGRLTGARRGSLSRTEPGCEDYVFSISSCPEDKRVTIKHHARKELDALTLSPFVTVDFFLTRHFAAGGLFQAFLSRQQTLYALSFIVRLGE
jgi:hypothetical protein